MHQIEVVENAFFHNGGSILAINGGSSTLKFALFHAGDVPVRELSGLIDRIGSPEATFTWKHERTGQGDHGRVNVPGYAACLDSLMGWVNDVPVQEPLRAIGHRVVHGGERYSRPEPITPALLAELRRISPYDPEHMPAELALIEVFQSRYPALPQVACFDTAFHRGMPTVARLMAIPRRYEKLGVQRYGFHGLSYSFLMKELARIGKPGEAEGHIILAHLGNGASMAAVKNGRPVDTTMGFTPTSGLPMSRRSGDLDPGLVSYLARTEGMSVDQFHRMVNSESGLLGVSERSSDMRDLLREAAHDPKAAEAVALFCYQAKKSIGSLAVALGGLDTLVFSAGIGEHSPVVRARICDGLEFLGIALDDGRNDKGDAVISKVGGKVTVRVMHTDEEREIAESVVRVLGINPAME